MSFFDILFDSIIICIFIRCILKIFESESFGMIKYKILLLMIGLQDICNVCGMEKDNSITEQDALTYISQIFI
jgi:hypothetical protein